MLGPSSGSTPTLPAASAVTNSLRQATSTLVFVYPWGGGAVGIKEQTIATGESIPMLGFTKAAFLRASNEKTCKRCLRKRWESLKKACGLPSYGGQDCLLVEEAT